MVWEIFNLGYTALNANQYALNIVGHNIANADTEGYTRQRAEFVTSTPQYSVPGMIGTGVLINKIIRVNDAFTQLQLQIETRDLGNSTIKREILQQLENIFNEPSDTGLQSRINEFFSAWHTLADNPEDYGTRTLVVEKANSLTSTLNSMARQLAAIKNQIDESISLKIDRINEITTEIADLNDQISKIEVGGVQNANDFRDSRDLLVLELNRILDVRVRENVSSAILVETQGGVLVSGVHNLRLTTGIDENGYIVPVFEQGGARVFPESGELNGLLEVRDDVINDYLSRLDSLANTMVENVNRIHSRGAPLEMFTRVVAENGAVSSAQTLNTLDWDFAPTTGSFSISVFDSNGLNTDVQTISINPTSDTLEDVRDAINAAFPGGEVVASLNTDNQLIFESAGGYSFNFVNDSTGAGDSSDLLLALGINTFFSGDSAMTIEVSDNIKSDYSKISAAKSNSPGDNRTALDIANLQDSLLFDNDSTTFEDYYKTWVSNIGTLTYEALRNEDRQDSIVNLLKERLAQSAGVSLDEEATNLLKHQRAYQAAAKLIGVADELLQTLLNL